MPDSKPKGYWSAVFDHAAFLMNQRGGLSGETAYWLACRMVDRQLAEEAGTPVPQDDLDALSP